MLKNMFHKGYSEIVVVFQISYFENTFCLQNIPIPKSQNIVEDNLDILKNVRV